MKRARKEKKEVFVIIRFSVFSNNLRGPSLNFSSVQEPRERADSFRRAKIQPKNELDIIIFLLISHANFHGLEDLLLIPGVHADLILGHVRVPFLQDLDTHDVTGDLVSGSDNHPGLYLFAMGRPAADERPSSVHDDQVRPERQVDLRRLRGNKDVVEGME